MRQATALTKSRFDITASPSASGAMGAVLPKQALRGALRRCAARNWSGRGSQWAEDAALLRPTHCPKPMSRRPALRGLLPHLLEPRVDLRPRRQGGMGECGTGVAWGPAAHP